MKLEDVEAAELLELLFTNDDAELIVGQPEGITTTVWFIAIPQSAGGVARKSLSPRAGMLIAKLLDLAPVEDAPPAQTVVIEQVKERAQAKADHPSASAEPTGYFETPPDNSFFTTPDTGGEA